MLKVWMKPAESAATRWVWAGSTHTAVRLSGLTFTSASSCTSLTFHSRRQPSAATAAKTYGSRLPRKTTCSHQGIAATSPKPSNALGVDLHADVYYKAKCGSLHVNGEPRCKRVQGAEWKEG